MRTSVYMAVFLCIDISKVEGGWGVGRGWRERGERGREGGRGREID